MPGEAVRIGHDLLGRAFGHHRAAMDAGAGPHVDHIVRLEDGFLVMLDHDHRVAEIAQRFEGFQQPRIVALMEADRGLVQHVEHAGEP